METRAHHVIIGLFTVVGVAAALLFAAWLAQPASEEDYNYYLIAFSRTVSGLSVGSRVEYSGVRVGEVIDLQLNPENPQRVRALIRVEQDTPVNVDTEADLALENISGTMKIQLQGGTQESPRLHGSLPDPPVITAEPSTVAAVLESSEELFARVNEFVENANKLLSDQNIQRVSQTLAHLEATTRTFADQRDDISEAVTEFAQLGKEANRTLEEIRQLAGNTDTMLNDPERGALARAARSAARLETLLAENEASLQQGMQSVGELGPALAELRGVLGNLNRITRRLEENPRSFLLGGEETEEFEP